MSKKEPPAPGPRPLARWTCLLFIVHFVLLSAVLIYKHHALLESWPFDQAYVIQEFHNWKSGYPEVTLQPGDLRSGLPGTRPFEETHTRWIYNLFKVFYRLWPYPETLILLDAFFTSLSIVTLFLFLKFG